MVTLMMLGFADYNELVGTTSLIKLWNTDINVNVEQNCQLDRTLLVGTPGSTLTGTSYTLYPNGNFIIFFYIGVNVNGQPAFKGCRNPQGYNSEHLYQVIKN